MELTEKAKEYHDRLFENDLAGLETRDPEFVTLFRNFALDEIVERTKLIDDRTRMIIILSTLIGSSSKEVFKLMASASLNMGLSAIEIKEISYQGAAYIGIGRAYPMIDSINEVLEEKGIKLPLEKTGTTTRDNRREKGTEKQVEIFGDSLKDAWKKSDINYFLASNCFGDYYTREGLSTRERELVTFFILLSQGGCDLQLSAHAKGNINVGNTKEYLKEATLSALPFIGYPRTLNALNAIENA